MSTDVLLPESKRAAAVRRGRDLEYFTVSLHMRSAALIVSILLVFGNAVAQTADAPEFSLRTMDGRTVREQDLKDDIVVLDFWATWCVQCVEEIPGFNKIQKKYGSRGVKVLGLAVQSGWERDVKRFVSRYGMRYTILIGNDDTVADFGVIAFPTTYVIGPGWKIYKKYSGSQAEKMAGIEQDIEALLRARKLEN